MRYVVIPATLVTVSQKGKCSWNYYYYYYYYYYWSLLYSAVLRCWADSLRSHVILHEWIAFYSAFLNIHRSGVLTALAWLVPHETAAISARSVYTIQPCTMSLHAKPHTQGVCVFSCNLPPALLAEWPGSFTCYFGKYQNNKQKVQIWDMQISPIAKF